MVRPSKQTTSGIWAVLIMLTIAFVLFPDGPDGDSEPTVPVWTDATQSEESLQYTSGQPEQQPQSPRNESPGARSPKPASPGANPDAAGDAPAKPKSLSKHVTEYHIQVSLDEGSKQLAGTETVTWTNPGTQSVRNVVFHLYPNAFRSEQSTFIRESEGRLRNDKMQDGSWGEMRITGIRHSGEGDLLHRTRYLQPDDGNTHDRTLMEVKLADPIPPGGKVTLHLQFEVDLPQVFARMGYHDDFVMAGQWFPKLAAYERKGSRGKEEEGWNLHQYHGNSEFYADFGIYSVQINVPQTHVVAASGFPTGRATVADGRKTYRFYADDVHDFAWAASPHFIYAEEPYADKHIPGVKIKLYLDPVHAELKERYFFAAKQSLKKYSEWFGSYPYSTLSIVVPPEGANGAGGMEYPTLITAWGAAEAQPDWSLEQVLVHEIGHQYWHGMVANNEFEEAWLDEGFTSYAEDKAMKAIYDLSGYLPLQAASLTSPAPLKQNSWEFENHRQYADNVYTRAKLVLIDIESQIGEAKMQRVLRTYFQQWRFKHPGTDDFRKVLEKVSGQSWEFYFQQYVHGGLVRDFSIRSIDVRPIEDQGRKRYESIIVAERSGGFHRSVPIRFGLEDGTILTERWDGEEGEMKFRLIQDSPVEWAAIDPDRQNVLDTKPSNNFMRSEVDEVWQTRWNTGVSRMLETLIGLFAW